MSPAEQQDAAQGLIYILFAIGLYFIPAIVAKHRRKKDGTAIFLLNLFLGWTFIGWVIALVWAVKQDQGRQF